MPIESPIARTLREIHALFKGNFSGKIADYIPELAKANPEHFGIALVTADGQVYEVGDTGQTFTIQSISKPFVYGLALEDNTRADVLAKVGVEPTGEAFNSISLHPVSGSPMNPMINAGAIATTGMIQGGSEEKRFDRILSMFETYAGRELSVDTQVYESESATGHRNRAIGHMLRNFEILQADPNPVLELYFRQCSISVSTRDLGIMAATLANMGKNPVTGARAIRGEYVESVLSVMGSCGMYDYAGEWIYRVGMPAKSGVAGGILAVLPGQLGIGVYSPLLDEHGNSVRGIEVCNKLSLHFNLHIFNATQSLRSVIRLQYDSSQVASNRKRSRRDAQRLLENAKQILVYELQGELVFSTAEVVVRDVLATVEGVRFVVIDLKRVLSIDQSACLLFSQLVEAASEAGAKLIFSHVAQHRNLRRIVKSWKKNGVPTERWVEFNDNNEALEYCEDEVLTRVDKCSTAVLFEDLEVLEGMDDAEVQLLKGLTRERHYAAGETILRMGDKADSLFFLTSGAISVQLPLENDQYKRLISFDAGVVFGEVAFVDGSGRSAMVFADRDAGCYELARAEFDELGEKYPRLKIKLLENLLLVFSASLRKANRELATLAQ